MTANLDAIAAALFTAEGTRARTAKVTALAEALAGVAAEEPERLPFVARFITGTLVPTEDDRVLGVGGALVFEAVATATGVAPATLGEFTRRSGDFGTATSEAIQARIDGGGAAPSGLTIAAAEDLAARLLGSGTGARADKLRAIVGVLEEATPLEGRYVVRAILGEMRIGAREGIVEDAIAKAFGRPLGDVRTAHGLVSDVGELARLAFEDRLGEARIVLGRPVGFMLATPIETARGADLTLPHAVEDKIDGIRAQAHVTKDGVRLFARGKGSVTAAFPDVTRPLAEAARTGKLAEAILDGEIVVVASEEDSPPPPGGSPGGEGTRRVRPFSAIQPRLKKNEPDEALLREHPVDYLVYDILHEAGTTLLGLPFSERRARLAAWAAEAPAPLRLHVSRPLVIPTPLPATEGEGRGPGPRSGDARKTADLVLDEEFAAARSRGFEGLVLKRLDAAYAAGVRGFAWLKVKKALGTLDVVVVGAERGHGKRAGVLSDYTFSVWDGGELKTIGKAYNGLTDVEIAAMTERLRAIALPPDPVAHEDKRGVLPVKPEIVLEIAFDGLQRSDRHTSGFALRFPRIARIRDDKKPEEADSIDAVRALFDAQLASGHREDRVAADRTKTAAGTKKGGRKSGRRPDVRQKSKQLRLFDDD